MTAEEICARIKKNLPGAEITANDLTGGGDHWQLTIVAEEFKDKGLVQQHQLVYAALGEWMDGPIHALSLDTRAP